MIAWDDETVLWQYLDGEHACNGVSEAHHYNWFSNRLIITTRRSSGTKDTSFVYGEWCKGVEPSGCASIPRIVRFVW